MRRLIPPPESGPPPCAADPDKWRHNNRAAIEACRSCPIRLWCAYQALTLTGVQGVWASIYVPVADGSRRRIKAIHALRDIAAIGGYYQREEAS
jgi:WhiB family redox-sensing transcriptional regulator